MSTVTGSSKQRQPNLTLHGWTMEQYQDAARKLFPDRRNYRRVYLALVFLGRSPQYGSRGLIFARPSFIAKRAGLTSTRHLSRIMQDLVPSGFIQAGDPVRFYGRSPKRRGGNTRQWYVVNRPGSIEQLVTALAGAAYVKASNDPQRMSRAEINQVVAKSGRLYSGDLVLSPIVQLAMNLPTATRIEIMLDTKGSTCSAGGEHMHEHELSNCSSNRSSNCYERTYERTTNVGDQAKSLTMAEMGFSQTSPGVLPAYAAALPGVLPEKGGSHHSSHNSSHDKSHDKSHNLIMTNSPVTDGISTVIEKGEGAKYLSIEDLKSLKRTPLPPLLGESKSQIHKQEQTQDQNLSGEWRRDMAAGDSTLHPRITLRDIAIKPEPDVPMEERKRRARAYLAEWVRKNPRPSVPEVRQA
jgi:hypothetical protein